MLEVYICGKFFLSVLSISQVALALSDITRIDICRCNSTHALEYIMSLHLCDIISSARKKKSENREPSAHAIIIVQNERHAQRK